MAATALKHWDGERYRLLAWCVMPNHVHVVFRLLPGEGLAAILSSWKSYTAKEANRILGRTGKFWEREYWDRLIRSEDHLERAIAYVESNPGKAGLWDWPWVSRCGRDAPTTAGGTPALQA
jgi:REP-associated tyrosine transposase